MGHEGLLGDGAWRADGARNFLVFGKLSGMAGLTLLFLPISLQAQLVLSFGALGCMFFTMSRPDNKIFRMMSFRLRGPAGAALRLLAPRSTRCEHL